MGDLTDLIQRDRSQFQLNLVISCIMCFNVLYENFQVEVEVLVIEGPKLATVMNQVKKLEVSVLVVGQRRPSLFSWWVLI